MQHDKRKDPTPQPDGPLTPPGRHDPLNPDPANAEPIPLPPDTLPQPRYPVREPDPPPAPDPRPSEPTRLFRPAGFALLDRSLESISRIGR
jgi:hypothetical protein